MSTNTNVVRPLGTLERVIQILHEKDYYYNVGFTMRYKVPEVLVDLSSTSSSIPDKTKNTILQILYPTLEQTILKEPSLAVSLEDLHTSKPLFIRLSEIDLNKIVRFVVVNDDDGVLQTLEEEHAKKFNVQDSSIPLWRIVVGIKSASAESNDWNLIISLFYHHTILDGKSSFAFYSTFKNILNKNYSLQKSSKELTSKITLPPKSEVPFCKPIEECFDIKCSWLFVLKEIIKKKILSKSFKEKILKGYWLGDFPRKFPLSKHTSKLLLYSITAKELQSLLRKSHKINETSSGSENSIDHKTYRFSIISSKTSEISITEDHKTYEISITPSGDPKINETSSEDPKTNETSSEDPETNETSITSLFNIAVLFSAYRYLITASNEDVKKMSEDNKDSKKDDVDKVKLSDDAKKLAPFDTITIDTCIDLRPHSEPKLPSTQTGVYISDNIFTYKYPELSDDAQKLDFWEMSKDFKKQLEDDVPNTIKNLGIIEYLPNDQLELENTLKKGYDNRIMGRKHSIIVNNLGKYSKISSTDNNDNEWKIEDLIFSQSAVSFNSVITINIISYEDSLTFTVAYQIGAVSHEKVKKFGDGILKCLKFVAKNENENVTLSKCLPIFTLSERPPLIRRQSTGTTIQNQN